MKREGEGSGFLYFTHDRTYVLKTVKPRMPCFGICSRIISSTRAQTIQQLNSQTAPRRRSSAPVCLGWRDAPLYDAGSADLHVGRHETS